MRWVGPFAIAATLLWTGRVEAAEIGRIRAHLVYEETGRLSGDILARPDLALWNTSIGEGDVEEAASDLLILVEVVGSDRQEFIEQPLEISVRRDDSLNIGRPTGRVNVHRRFDSVLTSEQGRAWKALFLPDSTCAGRIEISARIGRSTRLAQLDLVCGE